MYETKTVHLLQENKETKPFEIEEVGLVQFTKSIGLIRDLLKVTRDNEELKEMVSSFLNDGEGQDLEIGSPAFMGAAMDMMILLMQEVPEKTTKLLCVLSGIDEKAFGRQKLRTHIQIFNAIMEVNDIEGLYEDGKKSFAATKQKLSWMNLKRKATA